MSKYQYTVFISNKNNFECFNTGKKLLRKGQKSHIVCGVDLNDSESINIGQTGRTKDTRLKEHKNYYKYDNSA